MHSTSNSNFLSLWHSAKFHLISYKLFCLITHYILIWRNSYCLSYSNERISIIFRNFVCLFYSIFYLVIVVFSKNSIWIYHYTKYSIRSGVDNTSVNKALRMVEVRGIKSLRVTGVYNEILSHKRGERII